MIFFMNSMRVVFFVLAINLFLPLHAYALDLCPTSGGKLTVAGVTPTPGSVIECSAPLDTFNFVFHQMTMCTSNPLSYFKGQTNVDPCFYLTDTTRGDAVQSIGITTSSQSSYAAEFPPDGTYTHGFVVVSAAIEMSGEVEFDGAIIGGNSARNAWTTGTFLGVANGASQFQNLSDGNSFKLSEVYSSTKSNPNAMTLTYDSLGTGTFLNELSIPSVARVGTIDDFLLLNSTGKSLAQSYADVVYMYIGIEYVTPKIVNKRTKTLTYKYSPSEAMKIVSVNSGGSAVVSILFGSAKFDIELGNE